MVGNIGSTGGIPIIRNIQNIGSNIGIVRNIDRTVLSIFHIGNIRNIRNNIDIVDYLQHFRCGSTHVFPGSW